MSNAPAPNNVFTKGFIPGLIVGLLVGLAVGVFMPALIAPSPVIKPNPNPPRNAGPTERDPVPPETTPADPAKPDEEPKNGGETPAPKP